MLVLSCLLICYNKRDEIEIELLKGGNISEDDIAAIRRLKSNKARDNTIDFDQLEVPRFGSRKRHVKVAPNQAELAWWLQEERVLNDITTAIACIF